MAKKTGEQFMTLGADVDEYSRSGKIEDGAGMTKNVFPGFFGENINRQKTRIWQEKLG